MTTHATIISANETLNAIVAKYPAALTVFHKYGLDTCCGGTLPLATAAQHHDLDVKQVLADLAAAQQPQDAR